MKRKLSHTYADSISLDNLCAAWEEFVRGKRRKRDVVIFSRDLMDNLAALHEELSAKIYQHGVYESFFVRDPKLRHIHKASVRDRVLHHALYRLLYPFFNATFIADSFSCQIGKGTHRALNRFREFAYVASYNHTRTCWVLKCDIRKFFACIDHAILLGMLAERIEDGDLLALLEKVIRSHSSTSTSVGLPLGNLTSQLLSNVYLNEFDQYVKHHLKAQWYVRYADDFLILSPDRDWLLESLPKIARFLKEELRLEIHPIKISLRTLASGVDFLGWLLFTDHRVVRPATRRRMVRRIIEHPTGETLQSYLGLLSHGNAHQSQKEIREISWLLGYRANT